MNLPDIMKKNAPRTVNEWEENRREEIIGLFEEYVYGVTPKTAPDKAGFSVVEEHKRLYDGLVNIQIIEASFANNGKTCSFRFRLFTPSEFTGKLPAVIMINPFSLNPELQDPDRIYNHLPPDLLTKAGYAAIHADVDSLCHDEPDTAFDGLISLFTSTKIPRASNGFGAIGAWAWAASRVVDYLVGRPEIDAGKIAVCGCSRAGKAALWCAAQDKRIALAISNVSGCTGAAVTRGKSGERIADITGEYPHWMCPNYARYSGREEDLPVDQHMLLALIAPRPLYVSSASEDAWADPQSEFRACVSAGEAYALYGESGLCSEEFPPVNTPVSEGRIAYHVREGAHGCYVYDWSNYLDFMNRFF